MIPISISYIGPRIRQARQEAGLSGIALAKLIDKSQPYVSDLERGQRTPSLETLCSLSAALGRPVSYFLGEDTARPASSRHATPSASPVFEVQHNLAELIAEQLITVPVVKQQVAMEREQMIRVVEQAIDNAYHRFHRTLRDQRRSQRTSVG